MSDRRAATTGDLREDAVRSAWFLSAAERDNPSASIDAHRGQVAWTEGNSVALLHGRPYYRALLRELDDATAGDVVLFTDWRGDPDELLDGPGTAVVDVLRRAANRGVRIHGLVWRSHPDRTRFSEEENRDLATEINAAGGSVLLDERVRRAGSHHQKMVVILHERDPARDVAFVGGIDLCHSRNDDERHLGDPQRVTMDPRFGRTPPWHDIQAEIHGPAIADIVATFRERWNDPTPLQAWWDPFHRAGDDAVRRPLTTPRNQGSAQAAEPAGTHAVQVLRTYPVKRPAYPFAPRGERSIALAYLKAFRRARRLITIEDQYLWSMPAARALGRALQEQPDLRLVVVVPRYPDEDGRFSGPPNRIGQLEVLRHLQRVAGPRFAIYDLETEHSPIYVHAKVCIIDDVWMTIGSDNVNRRSWTHDSELSCAVLDEQRDEREPVDPAGLGDGARVLARSTRLSLWSEHLQQTDLPVDPHAGFDLLRASADRLEQWHAQGARGERPPGRLRPHVPEPVSSPQRWLAGAMYRLVNDPDGRPLAMRLHGDF